MKALTVRQPWATLIAIGAKTIETRSWSTMYRGELAIHAAVHRPEVGEKIGDYRVAHAYYPEDAPWQLWTEASHLRRDWTQLAFGAVIATRELVDVVPISHLDHDAGRTENRVVDMPLFRGLHLLRNHDDTVIEFQRPYGDFTPGRYAWLLAGVKPIEPIPAKGRQGLWNLLEDLSARQE